MWPRLHTKGGARHSERMGRFSGDRQFSTAKRRPEGGPSVRPRIQQPSEISEATLVGLGAVNQVKVAHVVFLTSGNF